MDRSRIQPNPEPSQSPQTFPPQATAFDSEASFRAAFDASGIGMAICTVDGHWVRVNESLCHIIGYPREKLLGMSFLEITHPEDIELSMNYMNELLSGSTDKYRIEKRYIHADGHELWVRLTVSAVYNEQEELQFFVSQIEDITERRRLEHELRTVNERLNLAAQAGGVGVWDWDVVNDYMAWDDQMYALYGLQRNSFSGNLLEGRKYLHSEDWPRVYREVTETLLNADSMNIVFRIVRPDGEIRHLRAYAIVKRDANGKPVRMVGTNWDITHAIKQNEDLQRLAEKARQASEAKSQFLANISHEIRTPLNGVIGMTHLLLDGPGLEEQQRDTANLILSSSESLMTLINQILDFSKAEAGKLELDIHRFNLRAILRQVTAPIGIRAEKAGLEFRLNVDKRAPQRLRGDSGKLRQVIQNLADNAIKFTHKGSLHIDVRVEQETKSDICLRFSIADTGIGIAPEAQERLFSAFTQADSSTTRLYGGTGLGLAISKQIVELMKGRIGINSQPGKGSEFWFTATFEKAPETASGFPGPFRPRAQTNPSEDGANDDSADEDESLDAPDPQVRERVRQHAAHALLAEDNRVNQLVATGMLDRLGVTVDTAANGLEAIEAFRQTKYDLVFMDIQMPVVDGLEATLAIREWEAENRDIVTPIIAMTAHARLEDRRACLAAGMNECLVKPLSPDSMTEIVDRCLGQPKVSPTEKASRSAPLFDFKELCQRLGGDMKLTHEVLTMSIADIKTQLTAYQAARQANDVEETKRRLHAMIGVSSSASFRRLAAAASRLEKHLHQTGEFLPSEEEPPLEHILRESLTSAISYLASTQPKG